ncbi:hypothetical protein BDQ17DRAFT_1330794 [Cyathus striatus]|nr:hypothetical protein BDQ17DRAFT_1330794 [Cyathus striatus]
MHITVVELPTPEVNDTLSVTDTTAELESATDTAVSEITNELSPPPLILELPLPITCNGRWRVLKVADEDKGVASLRSAEEPESGRRSMRTRVDDTGSVGEDGDSHALYPAREEEAVGGVGGRIRVSMASQRSRKTWGDSGPRAVFSKVGFEERHGGTVKKRWSPSGVMDLRERPGQYSVFGGYGRERGVGEAAA